MATTLVMFFVSIFAIDVGGNHQAFADDDDEYDQIIEELAKKYRVESALVKAVIRAESGFDPEAVSPKGARGLMQLMPRIARKHGVADPNDPRQNIRGGVRMLRSLLDRFDHDPRLALAAYNAGGPTVRRFRGLPPYRETHDYVRKVLRFRARYLTEEREEREDQVEREEPAEVRQEQVARVDVVTRPRPRKESRPRGAETIWYGAPQASDGSFQAVFHSPATRPGAGSAVP
jgi:transglycosylase-like protein with SLT domain